jgi:hypothetical protein
MSKPAVKARSPAAVRIMQRTSGEWERDLKIWPRVVNIWAVKELSFLGRLISTWATYSEGEVTVKNSVEREEGAILDFSFLERRCKRKKDTVEGHKQAGVVLSVVGSFLVCCV